MPRRAPSTNFLKEQDDDSQDDMEQLLKRFKAARSGSRKAYKLESYLAVTEESRTGWAPTWTIRCLKKTCTYSSVVELTPRSGGGNRAHPR